MADTTLNPEDLLKLAGVEEGFNNKKYKCAISRYT